MSLFLLATAILVLGYFTYGALIDRVFRPDTDRSTPALRQTDGVDYVPMSWPKIFLIQLLNIAGLGPIFGALAGALWGPVAYVWIVFGTLFAGGVHDYLSGMISIRNRGASFSELTGAYLGKATQGVMRVFCIGLMVLVGAVFVVGPAKLLAKLTPDVLGFNFWMVTVFCYYFLATMLPIDKLIGRVYPVFGVALVIMAAGIAGGLLWHGYKMPEFTLANLHPKHLPIWPLMCISIACGAISGFHATQSPMMARCLKNERYGHRVFYGAMVAEGIIALIWATAGMAFFHGTDGLGTAMAAGGPAVVVHDISFALLGKVGGLLALIGVIVCPITSGDTAFRSARLMIADWLGTDQKPLLKRTYVAVPLFIAGIAISQMKFDVVWRYFAWANQTLAMVVLWLGAVYLVRRKLPHWFATIPATFMTAVSSTYLLIAPEGFSLPANVAYPSGAGIAAAVGVLFLAIIFPRNRGLPAEIAPDADRAADTEPELAQVD